MLSKKYNVLLHEPLAKHSTIRIGGMADVIIFPNSVDQLLEILNVLHDSPCPYGVIGNGSNILFADSGFRGIIIKMRDVQAVERVEGNSVMVGAGTLNQVLIKQLHQWNLGGFEYLYSVPGTIGGAIYMNAGRGSGPTIADHVVRVDIWDNGKLRSLSKEECAFSHRYSIFHDHKDWIICSVVLQLQVVPEQEGIKKRRERLEFVKGSQNKEHPNLGSIFKQNLVTTILDPNALQVGGAQISPINTNWICNINNASEQDVRAIITMMIDAHVQQNLPKPVVEIEYFNEKYS